MGKCSPHEESLEGGSNPIGDPHDLGYRAAVHALARIPLSKIHCINCSRKCSLLHRYYERKCIALGLGVVRKCARRRTIVDPIRSKDLKKTIETVSRLLDSELFDPNTREKAEGVKRALEKELEGLEKLDRS